MAHVQYRGGDLVTTTLMLRHMRKSALQSLRLYRYIVKDIAMTDF